MARPWGHHPGRTVETPPDEDLLTEATEMEKPEENLLGILERDVGTGIEVMKTQTIVRLELGSDDARFRVPLVGNTALALGKDGLRRIVRFVVRILVDVPAFGAVDVLFTAALNRITYGKTIFGHDELVGVDVDHIIVRPGAGFPLLKNGRMFLFIIELAAGRVARQLDIREVVTHRGRPVGRLIVENEDRVHLIGVVPEELVKKVGLVVDRGDDSQLKGHPLGLYRVQGLPER